MTRSASAPRRQPDPFLVWDGGVKSAAESVISMCKTVEYWSPRGRTCLVELDALTGRGSKTKGYGDAIMAAVTLLEKRKIITYHQGVITIDKIHKPEIEGKLTRNRPAEGACEGDA